MKDFVMNGRAANALARNLWSFSKRLADFRRVMCPASNVTTLKDSDYLVLQEYGNC